LRYEPEAVEQLRSRSATELERGFFDVEVELEVLNIASGRGSIEKPRLEVHMPDGTETVQYPDTQERKSEPILGQPGVTRIWVERWGNSYSISPRERLDDALSYVFEFSDGEVFRRFLNEFDETIFTLLYRDHRGREKRLTVERRVEVDMLI
jgi:hypothetical protein